VTLAEFNPGAPEDFRVPDGGLLAPGPDNEIYLPTAALVFEIVSPGGESWEKLPFYAAHHVEELLIVDPATRSVDWLGLDDHETESNYHPIQHSALIELGPGELARQIDWPAGA
jgi:Uma2 family endonuclease